MSESTYNTHPAQETVITSGFRTRIAVVLACFNRKDTTLRCLRSLFAQKLENAEFAVHLLDDASPDGTGAAVRAAFPQVTVIDGDGSRFWGGGMHAAMLSAAKTEFDFLLWLNDDVELRLGAISLLLKAHAEARSSFGDGPHIIAGAVVAPQTDHITYSGFRRKVSWHPAKLERVLPNADRLTQCDTMNGNCVLIPAEVVKKLGPIDPVYVQQLGDLDYGYRAVRAGVKIWLASQPVGSCPPNLKPKRWQDPSLGLFDRLRVLNTPHGLPIRPWFRFMTRFGGPVGAVILIAIYLRSFGANLLPNTKKLERQV